jgi:hypothetical protein
MSRLDIAARVYPIVNGVEDTSHGEAPCMWFALCDNPANGLRNGPVSNGEFGEVPICQRCDDKVAALAN